MLSAVSPHAFREALAHFASGVTIVAAHPPSGPVGFTATGFTSVSLAPPLVLVCIDRDASAHDGVVGAEHFGISILDESQSWIASQFARSGVDRFEGVPLAPPGPTGAPTVEGALARIVCRRHARHDAGDHSILIGEVIAASVSPGRPLLHFARAFGAFVSDGHRQSPSGQGE
jgi:flavin reductase (DIM6/NTAB) family NADH-FMN oxidoreductase RutF